MDLLLFLILATLIILSVHEYRYIRESKRNKEEETLPTPTEW
jgi:hypothetical protein